MTIYVEKVGDELNEKDENVVKIYDFALSSSEDEITEDEEEEEE